MGSLPPSSCFVAPTTTHSFSGFLFDLDGTIIDSTDAIVKHWYKLGAEIGMDPLVILETSHGRRSIDTLEVIAPDRANWDYVREIEGLIPREYGKDAVEIPGSRQVLKDLDQVGAKWAIVTSGSAPLVEGWINVLRLARPDVLVTAEDVARGKPDPACYRLGFKRLGLQSHSESQSEPEILVIEDAPSGIRAGKAAGFKVLGLATTHSVEKVRDAGADWIVQDLTSLKVVKTKNGNGTVQVEISNALVF